jgi:hypothetical protein
MLAAMPLWETIAALGIGAAAATAGIVAAVDQPKAPTAPAQTTTTLQQSQATQAAAQAQATALTQRRGMASTMLTSPMGVSNAPTTQRATLGA